MVRSLALSVLLVASAAGAQPTESVDELETRGQALARDGKYAEAIAMFRAAERTEPRAIHDCLIGLAYLRMGALADAEIAFDDCDRRAGGPTNLPPWVAKERATHATQLADSAFGTVNVRSSSDIATLSIPGILDGQSFAARPHLHLAPGTYEITGHATDGRRVARPLTVSPRGMATVTLSLTAEGGGPHESEPPTRRHTGPLTLTIAGGAVVLAGAAMHLFWAHPRRVAADEATDMETYNRELGRFETARAATIASYAVGGVALIAGLVWWKQSSHPPQISAYATGDGGVLVVQWQH